MRFKSTLLAACLVVALFSEESGAWLGSNVFLFAPPHLRNPDRMNYFFEERGVRLVEGRVKITLTLLKEPADTDLEWPRPPIPKTEKVLFVGGAFRPFALQFGDRDWELKPQGGGGRRRIFHLFQFVRIREDLFNVRECEEGQPRNFYPVYGLLPGDEIEMVTVIR